MPAEPLNLALWQVEYAPFEIGAAEALRRLEAAAAQARHQSADVLLCPEMSLTGYAIGADRVRDCAQRSDGPLAKAVAAIAQRHQIAIVYGYPERHPAGYKPFNAAQAIDATGKAIGHCRKTHLFGDLDRAQFSAGDTASKVFSLHGWQLGLLICYDVEFPEATCHLALQGADAVLVPTANMRGYDEVPQLLVPARAYDNRVCLAYANACGQEGSSGHNPISYGGMSTVAQANGHVSARAGRGTQLLCATLDPATLIQARQGSPLPFRRPALYPEPAVKGQS
jgi:predicted amidohydrolase